MSGLGLGFISTILSKTGASRKQPSLRRATPRTGHRDAAIDPALANPQHGGGGGGDGGSVGGGGGSGGGGGVVVVVVVWWW